MKIDETSPSAETLEAIATANAAISAASMPIMFAYRYFNPVVGTSAEEIASGLTVLGRNGWRLVCVLPAAQYGLYPMERETKVGQSQG